jgi:uncharacterized protein (DUF433 family)
MAEEPARPRSEQRSFRLSRTVLEALDARAAETGESRNALAERLLGEAVRVDRHPLIQFRQGASGLRRPTLAGTRVDVWQVVAALRDNAGSVADTAAALAMPERLVRAAISYYADHSADVDAYATEEAAFAERERERWEREQQLIA